MGLYITILTLLLIYNFEFITNSFKSSVSVISTLYPLLVNAVIAAIPVKLINLNLQCKTLKCNRTYVRFNLLLNKFTQHWWSLSLADNSFCLLSIEFLKQQSVVNFLAGASVAMHFKSTIKDQFVKTYGDFSL